VQNWDCKNCGTQQIDFTIEECPVCHNPKPEVPVEPVPAEEKMIARQKAYTDGQRTEVVEGPDNVAAEQGAGTEEATDADGASPEPFPAGDNADAPPPPDEAGYPAEQTEEVHDGSDNN
jgi:hypothetical protein